MGLSRIKRKRKLGESSDPRERVREAIEEAQALSGDASNDDQVDDGGSFIDALGMSPTEVEKAEEAAEAVLSTTEQVAEPPPAVSPSAEKTSTKTAKRSPRAAKKPAATAKKATGTSTRKRSTAAKVKSTTGKAAASAGAGTRKTTASTGTRKRTASKSVNTSKRNSGGGDSSNGGFGSGGGDDLRNRWNASDTEYPRNSCMHELFEKQAKATPDAIVAICDGEHLTYGELDERANYLALYLREQGVAHGELVGLLLERSLDMLVGLIGIFKAGAAYLPLDPNYPGDRLAYMFEDAEIQTLLTEKALMDNLPDGAPRAIQIDEDWPEIEAAAKAAIGQRVPLKKVDAESLAYVIYTSGSTGKPKGVMIQHRALTNFLVTMADKPGCSAKDHVIALTTICFDIAALELYLPLIVGARVDILPSRITRDGLALKEYLDNTQPTLVQATPATWTMLLAAEWRGQTNRERPLRILTGGEPLTEKLAEQLLERATEVWNMYGPTETTIWSSVWQAGVGEKISIGWPIANTQFYILNEDKELMDVGQEGELWIGGDGVAKGYLNREQYNRERFIQNPHSADAMDRIYKTGDLVRLCDDGRVECLGRVDQQIKLRGHRIELGEIESQLAKLPAVREAVVTAREDVPGNRDLVGFLLVQDGEGQPKNPEIAATIAQWLPQYMVPTRYFWLTSYPETLNRKVDRKTLTEKLLKELLEAHGADSQSLDQTITTPDEISEEPSAAEVSQGMKSLLEERLIKELKGMASEILGIPAGDFDSETPIGNYGFNSVNHTTLSIRMNKGLGIKTNPTLFFQHPTFKAVGSHLAATFGDELRKHFGLKESDVKVRLASPGKATKRKKVKSKVRPAPAIKSGEHEPIAIVGVAARMPGSEDTEGFWKDIVEGKDLIREIPETRWDHTMFFGDQAEDHLKITSKWGGYIEGAFQFDAPFFNISPREAELMDPEQRLFMQAVWHAIENSGHATSDFGGSRTGVFLGVTGVDYMERQWQYRQRIDGYTYQGVANSIKSNRISYMLDLHGPSSSIDTACSSALIAVVRAVESIRAGHCEMALAGGVSLLFSPYLYIAFSRADMLSPDGRCKTFDKDANGYVRGEGVGSVVLKPLSMAEADGDHIYGVIRGVSENHGGRTNTLSAPNPNAQAELLYRAYEDGKVDPKTVSFIETHGTGTPLGDPIEVNGIKKAFEQLYQKYGHEPAKEKHVGLGSVKTQIGHLEGAAGIAGLMKVLLSMQHKTLPGNLHFRKLNPYISLDNSPFYVNHKTQPWQPILDGKGNPLPRRAGVSSFGYGGSNAHIVVEEYIPKEVALPPAEPQLFLLSAKNNERLDAYAASMLKWLQEHLILGDLPNEAHLAYTLQIGRDPMQERLAIVFGDYDDLIDKLAAVLGSSSKLPDGVYRGHVRDHRSLSELIGEGEEGEAFVQSVLDARRLTALARFWIAGVSLDFDQLHEHYETRRVPLPVYPFAPTRFRFQESVRRPEEDGVPQLHPLINTNESTLYEQCFRKNFTGREFVLSDNIVGGNEMLMSTSYLEMARAAGNLANKPHQVTVLKDVVFVRRYAYAKKNASLFVRLFPRGNEVRFEISSDDDDKRNVDSQGKIVYGDPLHDIGASEVVDIQAVEARCWNPISGEECYNIWDQAGIKYGSSLQALKSLRHNDEECIAELELPEHLSENFGEWSLHPSLLAGSLQSIVGLVGSSMTQNLAPLIAFSVGEVRLIRPLSQHCFAYVRRMGKQDSNSSFQKFNITLMDEEGRVQVVMKDFAMRPMASSQRRLHLPSEQEEYVSVYLQGVWEQTKPLVERIGDNPFEREVWGHVLLFDYDGAVREELIGHLKEIALEYDKVVLVKPGMFFQEDPEEEGVFEINPSDYADYQQLVSTLKERGWMPTHIMHLWSREPFKLDTSVLTYQMDLTLYSSFYLVKSLMAAKPREEMTFIHVHLSKDGDPQPQYSAVCGMLRTLRKENHKFQTRSIEYCMHIEDHPEDVNHDLANLLIYEGQWESKSETEILYKEGHRWTKCLQEIDPESEADPSKLTQYEDEDVYLITGGAGGLGLMFAKHLATQARVRLVLVGRSKASARVEDRLEEVRALGAEATYVSADVALRDDVEQVAEFIRQEYGRLDGVIHAAGVVRDAFVLKKTREEMEDVIAPKVFGTLNLDDATKDFNLRFFVVFSSLSGVIGNLGQADYAYANYFMDGYMALREEYRIWGDRRGKSLALDWPLWRYGGMQVDEEAEKLITQTMGMRALSSEVGLDALKVGLRIRSNSLLVVEASREKLRQSLGMRFVGSRLHNLLEGHRGYSLIFPDVYSSWVRMPSLLEMGASLAEHSKEATETDSSIPHVPDEFLSMHTEMYLKEAFSKETKLPVHKIAVDEALEEYGIDSVMILRMNAELESFFGELPKTLLFEYQTIEELKEYFMENYRRVLVEKLMSFAELGLEQQNATLAAEAVVPDLQEIAEDRFMRGFGPAVEELEVAIVGMAGRFPGADDLQTFWDQLKRGYDAVGEVPEDRWDWRRFFSEGKQSKFGSYSKWGGFLSDVDKFDPLFFNISPREAELMDPQERLFLEAAYATLGNAGYCRKDVDGTNMGVFVGVTWGEYTFYGMENALRGEAHATDSVYASVANRVSYWLNVNGPSLALDTMCSSSFTALHYAVEGIRRGEMNMAIAGGVNLSLHPSKHILLCKDRFASTDGRCRAFGEGGDGYVPGEGVAAVLLKPLNEAVADGDHIYGIIKGTALNHGGKTNGYSVPNPVAQGDLIKKTLERAKVDPRTLSYIEAHGTGTSLGDPIEMSGLNRAFNEYKPPRQFCPIGSVKSNIGHLEAAAGVAGLVKVLLQMEHRTLVPSIHSEHLNPNISFKDSPFYVQRDLAPWPKPEREIEEQKQLFPRMAGISSFGAGGANAHVIISEFEDARVAPRTPVPGPKIVVLSAETEDKLREYAGDLVRYIDETFGEQGKRVDRLEYLISLVRQRVVSGAAGLLEVEPEQVAVDADPTDMGMDTVLMSDLHAYLCGGLGLEIPENLFKQGHSLNYIARELVALETEALMEAFGHQLPKVESPAKDEENDQAVKLEAITYTLQVGRDSLQERLGFMVNSLDELRAILEGFANATGDKAKISRGTVKISKNKSNMVLEGEEGRAYLCGLLEKNKLGKLLQIWLNGEDVEWRILYGDKPPRRVPLPTAPLDRKVHWKEVPDLYKRPLLPKLLGGSQALRSFNFSAALNANTWFLEQSPLATEGLLSGAVLLEIALGAAHPQIDGAMQLSETVWVNAPLLRHADQSVELVVSFEGSSFEIGAVNSEGQDQLLAQGRVDAMADGAWQVQDLDSLRGRLTIEMARHEIYSSLTGSGLAYGENFRALTQIALGSSEALARIEVNPAEMFSDAVCHPALWEGAMQAATLVLKRERGGSWLNDGVQAFALKNRMALACWVHVVLQPSEATRSAQCQIVFMDGSGKVIGLAQGVSFEQIQVKSEQRKAPAARPAKPEYRLLAHGWRKDGEEPEVPARLEGTVVILANQTTASVARELLSKLTSAQPLVVVPTGVDAGNRDFDFGSDVSAREAATAVLNAHGPIVGVIDISDVYQDAQPARIDNMGKIVFLQEMIRANKQDAFPMHHYTRKLVAFENDAPTLAGGDVAGLYRMLGAEYGKVQAKTIDVDLDLNDKAALRALVFRELCIRDRVGEVCYRNGLRYLPTMREVHREAARAKQRQFPLTDDKVYVVSGGTRGIGSEIAARLVKQGARKIVVMGFTPLPPKAQWQAFVNDPKARPGDVEKVQRFLKLQQQGAEVEVYCGALTDIAKLSDFFGQVRKNLGAIGGVIHCAGSDLNNNPAFINKAAKDMAWVAEAKLPGLEALRTVFADDKMDFFVMFSSVAAVLPSLGTGIADYAYANAYLDYVAQYEKVQGRPWFRAFQWPSWRDVGMGEVKSVAYRNSGLAAMPTEDGMRLMELALTSDEPVLLPCLTEVSGFTPDDLLLLKARKKIKPAAPRASSAPKVPPASLKRALPLSTPVAAAPRPQATQHHSGDIEVWLRDLFAKELKMNPADMDGDTDFGDYGLESILLAELVTTISNHLKVELDPSLILEYPTLNGLSQHLREAYPGKCGASATAAPTTPAAPAPLQAAAAPQVDVRGFVLDWMCDLVGRELKIAPAELDVQAGFEDLGVESIMLAELTQKISEWLKLDLDPSLILEFASIDSLSGHLVEAYGDAIRAKLPKGTAMPAAAPPVSSAPPPRTASKPGGLQSRFKTRAVHTGISEASGKRQPIAIIGMGCHFPKANSAAEYWHNLNMGIDCISQIPPLRWNIDDYYVQQYRKGKSISKWGGFIDKVEYFDPKYFGISEEEAIHMDPLVRQFLEVSAETMAHAGYGRKDLWNRKVGVYVGSRMANYGERIVDRMKTSVVGVAQNFIAAHVSHFFNFKGPNMVVDTACSSSLVSLHLACRGILSGECEMAMAGGVDILLDEIPYVELSEGKALSPTGKCYTFDKRANGFVPGEGAGAVLLKPLDKAIADGDRIYAVFEGSAVNNDGHTMGITTPNLDAQVEVIREALADARLSAREISLIESHGTATMIGDPIELKGLNRAFGADTNERGYCALSSVKSNMGHLLSAAGIASVIKVALAIHHRRIPASLNCETPNPRFDFSASPFFVQTQTVDWNPGQLLHAGMSGFGFGGTNAHVILGEADPALLANYTPQRAPLSLPEFQRKPYWLEKPNMVKRVAQPRLQDYDSTPAYDQLLDFDKIL